jgi:hypothetical protein
MGFSLTALSCPPYPVLFFLVRRPVTVSAISCACKKSKGSFIEAWICFGMSISLYIIEKYASILPMDFSSERCNFLFFCLVSWSLIPWNNKCMKFHSVSSWWCVYGLRQSQELFLPTTKQICKFFFIKINY